MTMHPDPDTSISITTGAAPGESAQHTPGPWRVDPRYAADVQTADGAMEIAACINKGGYAHGSLNVPYKQQGQANARLIAAAPDLLYALHDILPFAQHELAFILPHGDRAEVQRRVERALAALAAATGSAA